MGLDYINLDGSIRAYMLEEIDFDTANGRAYVSTRLNPAGCETWPELLRDAAAEGSDDTLASAIRRDSCLNTHVMRRNHRTGLLSPSKMPSNAADGLAQGEFNRFYIRGLCRFAVQNGIPQLIGYRARYSENPRPESEAAVGRAFDPAAVLEDLRTAQGEDTALKMPGGPNSGISLRLP